MNKILRKFLYKNVDKILDALVGYIQKLDRLVEAELAEATANETTAEKLLAEATLKRFEAERAKRVASKIKDLVA